jgi:hypothetical protein
MRPRLKGALLLCLAFVLGVGVGAAGFGIYAVRVGWPPRGERWIPWVLQRLDRELELRPDQHQRVENILRETRDEFGRLREEFRPRFREILNRSRDRIKAELNAAQQAKFDALMAEWERRRERWRGRDRPSGEAKDPRPARNP